MGLPMKKKTARAKKPRRPRRGGVRLDVYLSEKADVMLTRLQDEAAARLERHDRTKIINRMLESLGENA